MEDHSDTVKTDYARDELKAAKSCIFKRERHQNMRFPSESFEVGHNPKFQLAIK